MCSVVIFREVARFVVENDMDHTELKCMPILNKMMATKWYNSMAHSMGISQENCSWRSP